MVLDTKGHPESLKDQVCSPGGTSAHALHEMEKAGVRSALISAVEAGTKRAKEIGAKYEIPEVVNGQKPKLPVGVDLDELRTLGIALNK